LWKTHNETAEALGTWKGATPVAPGSLGAQSSALAGPSRNRVVLIKS
jgi:hypothetical protein